LIDKISSTKIGGMINKRALKVEKTSRHKETELNDDLMKQISTKTDGNGDETKGTEQKSPTV
jgi:hypothetical protein